MRLLGVFCFCSLFLPSIAIATLNYIHIPKAGGTTIRSLLKTSYGKENVYSGPKIDEGARWGNNAEKCANALKKHPLVTNHKVIAGLFPFWFFQNKDPHFETSFIFTSLREPVDRVISHYFYKRKSGLNYPTPMSIRANMMCKMLASDVTLVGEELLQDAIKSLHRMDFIIFMDDFEGGIRRLYHKIGLPPLEEIPHKNGSPRTPLSDEMIQKIREMNDLDIRLYEYATTFLRHKSY